MSEKFNITYRGKEIVATRSSDGKFFVRLPEQDGYSTDVISNENGWMFIRTDNSDIEYHFWMQLNDDGSLEHGNDIDRNQPGRRVSDYKYNPDTSYMGHLDDVAKEFYGVVEQLRGYRQLGVSPIDIIKIRQEFLDLSLKMLGYNSIQDVFYGEPDPGNSIMDLERAIIFIEQQPALAQYATKVKHSKVESVATHNPDRWEYKKENVVAMMERARKVIDVGKTYYDSRTAYLDDKRDYWLVPDFCSDMKSNVTTDDWEHYVDVTRRLGKLLLGFNADLLPAEFKMKVIQATSADQLKVLDDITAITDFEDAERAIDIESYYFMDEAARFEELMGAQLEDTYVSSSSTANIIKRHINENNAEYEKRAKKIKDRTYYRKEYLYRKIEEKEPEKISVEEYFKRQEELEDPNGEGR